MSAGQPVEIEAASAELDGVRSADQARLTSGVKYATGAGADAARTATAGQAVLHLRGADQTLERIEAQGNA